MRTGSAMKDQGFVEVGKGVCGNAGTVGGNKAGFRWPQSTFDMAHETSVE